MSAANGERKTAFRILAINPGSTSTKVAVFDGERQVFAITVQHPKEEIDRFPSISDQYHYRQAAVISALKANGIPMSSVDAVVGRGGLLRPIPGGVYAVDDQMVEDLKAGVQGQHASNLGGLMAREIGETWKIPSFIVDPVATDEFEPLARLSGLPEIPRRSLVHALSVKAALRRFARDTGMQVDDIWAVVGHLGGGISICAVKRGRIVDVNNANEEGPFSPERAGTLPVAPVVEMAFSGKYTAEQLKAKFTRSAGLTAYLGTNDGQEIDRRIKAGDERAALVSDAMAYQIAKEIGRMATVLSGRVHAVILTGGLARWEWLVGRIIGRVKFVAPVYVYPGGDEMEALAQGALRALTGEEEVKSYAEEVKKMAARQSVI